MILFLGDSSRVLKDINDNSIDLLVTDPPYGIEFMGKDWDKALVGVETWKECYRVLKQGKLAFVMCSPRQDVLSRMIINLQDAGFRTNYSSIYWTYASGFPKAANVSKLLDKANGRTEDRSKAISRYLKEKRITKGYSIDDISTLLGSTAYEHYERTDNSGHVMPVKKHYIKLKSLLDLDSRYDELIERIEAEREIIGHNKTKDFSWHDGSMMSKENTIDFSTKTTEIDITKPATEAAKAMEGAYVGFQPKPAVEVILVVSKGKTLTWLDDCRIPHNEPISFTNRNERQSETWKEGSGFLNEENKIRSADEKGRFPANLLCSDDVLNDGKITKSSPVGFSRGISSNGSNDGWKRPSHESYDSVKGKGISDEGSYSRYFSLDQWASVQKTFPFLIVPKASKGEKGENCIHPTVKPLKLMSYLITMGSREGDLILDPFCGSGTVCIAADNLHRKWIGIEINPEYVNLMKKRLTPYVQQQRLEQFLSNGNEGLR